MVIYKITNTVNDKVYVGQCKGILKSRFNCHMIDRGVYTNKFHAAVHELGANNFSIEVIDTADNHDELNEKEIFWIGKLNSIENGYNTRKGGGVPIRSKYNYTSIRIKNQTLEDLQVLCEIENERLFAMTEKVIQKYCLPYRRKFKREIKKNQS